MRARPSGGLMASLTRVQDVRSARTSKGDGRSIQSEAQQADAARRSLANAEEAGRIRGSSR